MAAHEPPTFFSYCRDDSNFALRLAEDLKAAGSNVWIDQLDIEPGMPWDRAVEDALNNCPCMLVILSPVSVKSDNVLDEISFAVSKQKRVIPVLYRQCSVPLRLARRQHIDFRTDYKRGLKLLLKALGLDQPPQAVLPLSRRLPTDRMPTTRLVQPRVRPRQKAKEGLKIFVSYSHQDEELCSRFLAHLSQLKREGLIEPWHDRRITAHQEWAGVIDEHLNSADIIILLVTQDFLASGYCYGAEMNRALERSENRDSCLVPVILKPCDWQKSPFATFRVLPKGSKPVVLWKTEDHGLVDAMKGLRGLISEMRPVRAFN